MKRHRLLSSALCAAAALVALVHAQNLFAAVILSGTSYSENFDVPDLAAASVTGAFSLTAGTQAAVPGSSGWDGVKLAGTGASNMNYTVDNGTGNSGAIYSYGATGSNERALGTLASASNIPGIGVEIDNNTGSTITSVTIGYVGEFWRSSTSTQNVLTFGYSVGATGSGTYLGIAGTPVAALNLVGPAPVTTNGLLDGNLAINQGNFSASFAVTILSGQALYLRWQDVNDIGNDAGLGIDNFQLTATLAEVPEPSTLVMAACGAAGLALIARRRRTA
jgi:hypothetical protein